MLFEIIFGDIAIKNPHIKYDADLCEPLRLSRGRGEQRRPRLEGERASGDLRGTVYMLHLLTYVCMFVCMYVRTYVYIYIYIYIYMRVLSYIEVWGL